MKGSAAMKGAARMRPTVMALGRFTPGCSAPLGERLQHQLAHCLERVEHPVALDGDRLEVGSTLDPLPARELLDEILAGVVGIGLHAPLYRVLDFPARIERGLQIVDRRGTRQVALVVLDDERHLGEVVTVLRHVVVEVLHRLEVRFHALGLGVADEDDAVDVLQYQLAAGVVIHLAGNRVQMEPCLEAANRAKIDGQEIEEESALGLGSERYELSSRLRLHLAVDVLEIRRLAAEPGTIVNDLTIDLARGVVDHRHGLALPHQLKSLSISSSAPLSKCSAGAAPFRPRENTRSINSVNSSISSFMRSRTRPTVVRESKIITSRSRRAMSAT